MRRFLSTMFSPTLGALGCLISLSVAALLLLLGVEAWLRSLVGAPTVAQVPPTTTSVARIDPTATLIPLTRTPIAQTGAAGVAGTPTAARAAQITPAPQPTPPTATGARETPAATNQSARVGPSGPTNVWVVVLHGDLGTEADAASRARTAAASFPDAGVLFSTDYPDLRPGFWVVYAGRYESEAAASNAAQRARGLGYPDAYARRLGDQRPGGSPAPGRDAASPERPDVRAAGQPSWWIVPFQPGWGNPREGQLYFGVTLENASDALMSVGVSFRGYLPGGDTTACTAPGGEGPGVTTSIRPRERARLVCQRSVVPFGTTLANLTMRLWDIRRLVEPPPTFEVADAPRLSAKDAGPLSTSYDVEARIRAIRRDVRTDVLFRFYDADGVQVATCESLPVQIEPEAPRRVNCLGGVIIDARSPQPATVRVGSSPRTP